MQTLVAGLRMTREAGIDRLLQQCKVAALVTVTGNPADVIPPDGSTDNHPTSAHARGTQLFVQVKMDRNDRVALAEFSQAMRQFPEVLECHAILGMFDFLLRVVAKTGTGISRFRCPVV